MRAKPIELALSDFDQHRLARPRRILLIEDDAEWAELIARILGRESNFLVTHAATEACARRELASARFDLLIVDRQLNPGDGLAVLREARERGVQTGAIVLTTLGDSHQIEEGLDQGGDDYVVKPPDPTEFMARVRSVLRRSDQDGCLFVGPIEINFRYNLARFRGQALSLRQQELCLLAWLALCDPEPVSMADLLVRLWQRNKVPWIDGIARVSHPGGAVDVALSRLRAGLSGAGIGRGLIRSHEPDMDPAEHGALTAIDPYEAKRARELTRRWSLDLAALS